MSGTEETRIINVKIDKQKAFDLVYNVVKKPTRLGWMKFKITQIENPNKLVLYGGRGTHPIVKAGAGIITFGIGTAVTHYGSPKRLIMIYFKETQSMTKITIQSEGGVRGDTRVAAMLNIINEILMPHMAEDWELKQMTQDASPNGAEDDPLKLLKTRYVKGEITKEEYEEIKKTLE